MPPRKLMLIRHGEKEPDSGPPPYGVNENGEQDKHSLSPRGWQRAGALVPFFHNPWAQGVERPDAIYASAIGATAVIADGNDVSKSLRPQQTVTPLAEAIGLTVNAPYPVGEEAQLAQTIQSNEFGVVLVAWEHNHIPNVAQVFCPAAPSSWPGGDRFDRVWVLTRQNDGTFLFADVGQVLLSGDS